MKRVFLIMGIVIVLMVLMSCVAFATDGSEGGSTSDFWTYITERAYVLVPVLYVVGYMIKKIPGIPDWLIPIVLLLIAVPLAMALAGWNIDGAIQGILVSWVTVLANQTYKQLWYKTE